MFDLQAAREFIRIIAGSESTPVTFQVFHDPKPPHPQNPKLAATFTSTLDEALEFITYRQSQHCGVYMCINGTDGQGREERNINHLRVFFADFDGRTEPQWTLQPHLVTKRDETHGHAFWLIDAGDLTNDDWSVVQRQIAMYYDTDTQVIDPSRVARLTGFNHYKDPINPQRYSIVSDYTKIVGSQHRYTVDDVRNSCVLSAQKDAELHAWAESRKGLEEGTGYARSERYEAEFTKWLQLAAPQAVEGEGTMTVIRVASWAHDRGIPMAQTRELMWEHYNPRCLPPWSDGERYHFDEVIQRAYKYSTSAAGCKTAIAQFSALPALPAPILGWEQQSKINDAPIVEIVIKEGSKAVRSDRINSDEAKLLLGQMDVKSAHYDFARCYDGVVHNGLNLIRSKKMFYVFNGRSWSLVDDDVIKADIQRAYSAYKPSDTFTGGIKNVLCDLVNVERVENGTWLDNPDRDSANIAVFKNGIVDLSEAHPTVQPHTHNYFTFNELSYNFDVNAKCPTWHSFLTSIWGDDEDLKLQLQQWMGYCLTSDTRLQKFAIFMGKSRGGKGVITDVITEMLGSANTTSPTLDNLTKDSTLHEMSTSSVALIPDAHSVSLNKRDGVLSNLKAITGGDALSYHVMYKGSQTTKFKTRIMMSTNNVPDFIDSSGALVNRMLVFPFVKSFKGREDVNLRAKLLAEISGVTQWAIEGLRSLRSRGNIFKESKQGLAEKEEIKEDMFPLSQFVKTMCEINESEFTSNEALFNSYRIWSSANGIKSPMTLLSFSKTLRNSDLPIVHDVVNGERGFFGITAKTGGGVSNVVHFPPVAQM